jgi:hypothetical protein
MKILLYIGLILLTSLSISAKAEDGDVHSFVYIPGTETTILNPEDDDTSDSAITRKVQNALSEDRNIAALTVTTNNGVVTLNGSVDAGADEDKAIRIAKSIHGVKDVKSVVTVSK